ATRATRAPSPSRLRASRRPKSHGRAGCGRGRWRSGSGSRRPSGLDDLPAAVPGWGTVLARTARSLLDQHRDGEWRVVLTDDHGRLQHLLLARRRPRPPGPRRPERRGRRGPAIVEIQVPTPLLAALVPDDHGLWAPLLRELQKRLGELGPAAPDPPDRGVRPDDARHRRPSAEVDRWVRVRDRRCVAPSCRRPAHATDLDHTVDHALGGPTLSGNLGAWCRHHHRAKHHGGWRVEQPAPGRFLVTTRAGAAYEVRPARVLEPLPGPRPASTPRPLPAHERDAPHGSGDEDDDPPRGLRRTREGAGRAAVDDGYDHDRVPGPAPRGAGRTNGQLASLRRGRGDPAAPVAPELDPDPPF
ncbi:MAG: endonuclease, partial [Actinomycetospora sp.]|nr:endonuclease [Actinomycetospora sp.]